MSRATGLSGSFRAASVAAIHAATVFSLLAVLAPQVLADHKQKSRFAVAVRAAQDLNADGYPDFVVLAIRSGARGPDPYKSSERPAEVHVYYGSATGAQDAPDLVLTGYGVSERFGGAIAVGDLDADGIADLVISAAHADAGAPQAGRVYVYYGRRGGIGEAPDLVLSGERPGTRLGHSLASGGDVNGDGIDDLVVGAVHRPGEPSRRGSVRVYLGRRGGPGSAPDHELVSAASDDRFGWAIALANMNRDGAADIVVGAPLHDGAGIDTGRVYIYLGGEPPGAAPAVVLDGEDPHGLFGFAIQAGSDYDGDGSMDLAIGAPTSGANGSQAGRVHVLYGRGGARLLVDDMQRSNNAGGLGGARVVLEGAVAHGRFGSVIASGDINGDGLGDLVIGVGPGVKAGAVAVYLGTVSPMPARPSQVLGAPRAWDGFGLALDLVDTDANGIADVLVGAPGTESGEATGRAILYRSRHGLGVEAVREIEMLERARDDAPDSGPAPGASASSTVPSSLLESGAVEPQAVAGQAEESDSVANLAAGADSVALLGQLDAYSGQDYSDVWGYAAAGREYALMGVSHGTTIIDVTDPSTPVEVAFIGGPSSRWRDIKTHAGHAYVTTEGSAQGTGMQIIDLANLPLSATLVSTYTATFTTAHNVYIADGFAYVSGASSGGVRILDLADPVNPVEVGDYADGGYVHDVYVRNDRGYFSSGSSQDVDIVDLTDKTNPQLLARAVYPFDIYNHQCWLTEDGDFLLCDDERNLVDLLVLDISDLSNIVTYTPYNASPARIHNIFVKGEVAHVSYYTDGYVSLSISDPVNPVLCGSYDTIPAKTSSAYDGAWGVYPFAPSGNVYVSDMSSGLYVLADQRTDTDRDGVGDDCDLDDDGDWLPDTAEIALGSNPLVPDVVLGLSAGLNLVSFPVEPGLDSHQWLAALGSSAVSVSRIDAAGAHETSTRLPGGTIQGSPFAVSAHVGYLVQMAAPTEHYATGTLASGAADIPRGMSVRGFAFLPGQMTAHRLLEEPGFAGAIGSISRFDQASGRFETVAAGGDAPVGRDFPLVRGEAYLLSARSEVRLAP